jgi:hypothetical protein
MADLLNNPPEATTKGTDIADQEQISILDLVDDLNRAKSVLRAVELGLQSHRISTEISDPLLWVLQDGLQKLEDVAIRIDGLRGSIDHRRP